VSPELHGLLAALGDVDDSPMAAKDREYMALLDAATSQETRVALMATLRGMRQHAGQIYGLLGSLVGQEPDGPLVPRAAAELGALLPDGLAPLVPETNAHALADALYADLDPAQAAAVRRALELVKLRQEESS